MFRPMRRARQALSRQECIKILKEEPRGVLSLIGEEGYPYGMPMNHWYCEVDDRLYFHGAKAGHKLDALLACDKASFCVYDKGFREEGAWPLHIKSVIVFGRMRLVEDDEKALWICRELAHKFTDDEAYIADEIQRSLRHVLCLELIPEHMSGKRVKES